MPRQLQVEHRRQEHPAGCLVACAQMVLQFIGLNQSQQELSQMLGLTAAGIPASHIQHLDQLGVAVSYGDGNEDVLKDAIDEGLPPIVFLLSGDLPYWHTNLRHAVLVVGYSDTEVFLNDPAFSDSPKVVSWRDFLLAWSEFDHKYALISLAEPAD